MAKLTKKQARQRRHNSLRRKITGTAARPRLAVFVSAKHVRAQLIDDVHGQTLASSSTDEKDNRSAEVSANLEGAAKIGASLASRAKEKGIESVVFDRAGFKYHGLVKALADSARESGLDF